MEERMLGRTGVHVSPLCLGAMMFGAWGNTDHDESIRIIHRALDARINFIDTADVYSRGESETIVGKALAGGRHDVVAPAAGKGLPDDRLRLAARVDVGGVDEVDPCVERAVDDPDARVVVGLPPRAEHHGAQAERADVH